MVSQCIFILRICCCTAHFTDPRSVDAGLVRRYIKTLTSLDPAHNHVDDFDRVLQLRLRPTYRVIITLLPIDP